MDSQLFCGHRDHPDGRRTLCIVKVRVDGNVFRVALNSEGAASMS